MMKLQHVCFLLVLCMISSGYACDMCGAPNPSNGVGITAQANRSSLSLVTGCRTFLSEHRGIFNLPDTYTKEELYRTDLLMNARVSKKIQLRFQLPQHLNRQKTEDSIYRRRGLGDFHFGVTYFLKNTSRADTSGIKVFRITITPGIKMPTGASPTINTERKVLFGGTGSWDATLNATVFYRKNKWGFMINNQFILRSFAPSGIKFGNGITNSALLNFYGKNLGYFCGVTSNYLGKTMISKTIESSTISRGYTLNGILGITKQINAVIIQANTELPIYQKLNEGDVKQRLIIGLSLTYLFEEK